MFSRGLMIVTTYFALLQCNSVQSCYKNHLFSLESTLCAPFADCIRFGQRVELLLYELNCRNSMDSRA